MYRWLAHLALRRHRAILLVSGIVLVLAALVLWRGGTLGSGTTEGIESDVAQRLISRELAYPGESSFIVLFRGKDGLTWQRPALPGRAGRGPRGAARRPARARRRRARRRASARRRAAGLHGPDPRHGRRHAARRFHRGGRRLSIAARDRPVRPAHDGLHRLPRLSQRSRPHARARRALGRAGQPAARRCWCWSPSSARWPQRRCRSASARSPWSPAWRPSPRSPT